MCLGELGVVVAVDGVRATVRTGRGSHEVTRLLAPQAAPGDHVVLHSGHVLAVLGADEAAQAAALRTATGAGSREQHPDGPRP